MGEVLGGGEAEVGGGGGGRAGVGGRKEGEAVELGRCIQARDNQKVSRGVKPKSTAQRQLDAILPLTKPMAFLVGVKPKLELEAGCRE